VLLYSEGLAAAAAELSCCMRAQIRLNHAHLLHPWPTSKATNPAHTPAAPLAPSHGNATLRTHTCRASSWERRAARAARLASCWRCSAARAAAAASARARRLAVFCCWCHRAICCCVCWAWGEGRGS
jgi:hypothetical protein